VHFVLRGGGGGGAKLVSDLAPPPDGGRGFGGDAGGFGSLLARHGISLILNTPRLKFWFEGLSGLAHSYGRARNSSFLRHADYYSRSITRNLQHYFPVSLASGSSHLRSGALYGCRVPNDFLWYSPLML